MSDQIYVFGASRFEAARRVEILPEGHRSRRLHGHSFTVKACARLNEGLGDFPGIEPTHLRRSMAFCVQHLDYRLLNEVVSVPTDENLARWIKSRLIEIHGVQSVSVQSTFDEGVDVDARDKAHVWRKFRFEAAHQLPNVPSDHQCGRMHGHGFEVILFADQTLGNRDLGVDYDAIGEYWEPLRDELHIKCLNEIPGLENPTSELLARWIWDRLKPELQELSRVAVYETATAGCVYNGEQYSIWKDQRFEAAVRLARAPAEDLRSGLHGHSFLARLHLTSDLDQVMGWTVDYGDVKEIFKPVWARLDHHRLDDIAELDDTDTISLVRWMRGQLAADLPQLYRLDLYETPDCGALALASGTGLAMLP